MIYLLVIILILNIAFLLEIEGFPSAWYRWRALFACSSCVCCRKLSSN